MNKQGQDSMNATPGDDTLKPPGFLDMLDILVSWRRFIIMNVLAVTLIAAIVSFVMPKWYKATASVLPPKDQGLLNLMGGTNSLLRGLTAIPKIGGFSAPAGTYNYFAILKSRSVMDSVIRRFDLISVYDISDSSEEKALKQLKDNVSFEYQDDDYITIEVYDKSPERAADIANYFVDILNRKSIELGTQEARNNREFVERRLDSARDSLRRSEESLKHFQEQSGMMISPEQSASVSAISELYALKAKKEIELAILQRTVTSDNSALQQTRVELAELDKKLGTFPQTGLAAYRLYRDVVTQQKIIEVLIPLFEQAKINEQKDIPVLLVLDKATPPERRARPQRLLIVFLAAVLSGLLFTLAAYLAHGSAVHETGESGIRGTLRRYSRRIAGLYRIRLS